MSDTAAPSADRPTVRRARVEDAPAFARTMAATRPIARRVAAACAALFIAAACPARAQERVELPGLDLRDGVPLMLSGRWFAARGASVGGAGAGDASARRPAVLVLHGCGGAFDRRGRLDARMSTYAALVTAEGWHALVLDSLGPRGVREMCTQAPGSRAVTQQQRRRDTLAALAWLAARPDVEASRLALVGWSNGGSTVLAATNARHPEVRASSAVPRAAVAFYPGCEAELGRGYETRVPLQLLLGGADDWTAPGPCIELARHAGAAFEVYAGAYHGFDGEAPVRRRTDVPGGVSPGQGVTVGGDAPARAAARARLIAFLREHLD